jgi:secreted trypsin-like serine protease
VSSKKGHFTLVGISSFGIQCGYREQERKEVNAELNYPDYEESSQEEVGNEKIYGIYTNVANYIDWIKDNSDYWDCEFSKLLFKLG